MMKINNFTKRIKSYFKIFILFIFIFVGWYGVSALELTYEKIDGIYSYVKRENETRLFYLKIYQFNGKPAYCIELGEDIVDNYYYSTIDYGKMGYSKEQIDYINLISYYGYEYLGHNDYRYYMATQELIWEYLEGIDIYWTNELSKDNPSKINIDSYLNEVMGLVNSHNKLPSIKNNYVYNIGENIEIIDSNERLSSYEIVNDDGIGAIIKDNKIIISNNGDKVGNYKIKLRQKVTSSDSGLIYYNDTSQTLYSMRGIKPNELEFEVEIKGAKFVLNKYDSKTLTNIPLYNGSLEGAIYNLYDSSGNIISELVTDINGQASIEGLLFGNYVIKESVSSYGYRLDENFYEVVIDNINNALVVYEEPDLKLIEIYKTYGDLILPEDDVCFDVNKDDGELFSTICTDDKGYASVLVPYGNYIISQNNTMDGYLKVDDIYLYIDENSDNVLTYTLNDEKIEVPIEDIKIKEIIINNPKTYDGINKNILLFSISGLILLGLCIVYLIRKVFNRINFKILNKFILVFILLFVGTQWVKAEGVLSFSSYFFTDHWGIATKGDNRLFFGANIYNGCGYSLDVGARLVEKLYNETKDYASLGFSDEDIDYINKLGYYGYSNPSHEDNFYYFLATQELIWEYLYDYEVYWTDQFSNTGRSVDISSYKDEILDLVSMDDILPSFNTLSYDYSIVDEIKIIDDNNVLYNYDIIDSNGLNVDIVGNSLVIDNKDVDIGEYTIRLRKSSYTSGSPSIYFNNSSLRIFVPGSREIDDVYVKVKINGVSLEVKRYDSITNSNKSLGGALLGGASYELYDDNNKLVSVFDIDDEGSAYINNLSLGNYTLKEISSSYGYRRDDKIYNIEVDDVSNEFIIYSDVIMKRLDIYLDVNDLDLFFNVYDGQGNFYNTINVNEDGYASIYVAYGKYYVSLKENMDSNYIIDDFDVIVNEESSDIINFNVNVRKMDKLVGGVIENPKTYDGIFKNYLIMGMSICCLLIICFYKLRKYVII